MRPLLSVTIVVAALGLTWAAGTTTAAAQAPDPVVAVVVPLPPIAGCEGYENFCSEGSDRAGRATGSGAYIDQIGQGHSAVIVQRRGSSANLARIFQSGTDQAASIDQDAASAFAEIVQSGRANSAGIVQGGSAHNTAAVLQAGSGNSVSIRQMAGVVANAASVSQSGDRNSIELTQTGGGNSATLTQDGDRNRMSVDQLGSNNVLTWEQSGSGLGGPTVVMDGNDRALTIRQTNLYTPR